MAILKSYELKGAKLSFANWISNLSPTETPFVSMTGKESVDQTLFQWQTDKLGAVAKNEVVEGSDAVTIALGTTTVLSNCTQILRKVVQVSDSANSLVNYGRGKELQYQMEKAGVEIKRDLEFMFLSDQKKAVGSSNAVRTTAGFQELVAPIQPKDVAEAAGTFKDPSTGAVVHKFTNISTDAANAIVLTEGKIFDLTYNLYLAGSKADIIMFHPSHANFFADLVDKSAVAGRQRMFDGDDVKFNHYINSIVDPLGQNYKLVPNRHMPKDVVYFFNASDWTQMVFRAPERTELAKNGSSEKWMIEMEVGLRHRNPFASGILKIGKSAAAAGLPFSEEAKPTRARAVKADK